LDPAYREKLSVALKGRGLNEQHREALSTAAKLRWGDPIKRASMSKKISDKAKLRWADPGHREKMAVVHANRPAPPGRPHTEEAKAKLRAIALARPRPSEETREKMRKSAVAARQRRKQIAG